MYQINLLEENDVFVSCGDPERDNLIKLSKKIDGDAIRLMAKMMESNIVLNFQHFWDGPTALEYTCGFRYNRTIRLNGRYCGYNRKIGFFDKNGQLYVSEMDVERRHSDSTNYNPKISIGEFKKETKYVPDLYVINPTEKLIEMLQNLYPFAYELWENDYKSDFAIHAFLMSPHLEQLIKANYAFAKEIVETDCNRSDKDAECFNRLCKRGNNLKEIFKTTKVVYESLKDERNLEYWDVVRKMFKNGTVTKDTIDQVVDSHLNKYDLENMAYILRQEHNGKKVFSFDSLIRYMRRLDMYEAICGREAYTLIKDYLRMCNQLNIEPKLDGDSLKREHDVTARTLRNKRDEIRAEKLNASCGYLAQYNYENDEYLIRGITSYDDLLDEAQQQHNCVACYADCISNHRSLIYVLRKKTDPDKSFVTVELSPNLKDIRQRFLAFNKPVYDKSVTDFLDEWLEHINKIKEEIA